jgi:Dolichyl-phosphate-mannose-protein mannosyltransferase
MPTQTLRWNNRLPDAFAIGIVIVVGLIVAFTFRDYGLGWDDYTHSQYAELLLAFYTSGFRDTRAFSFVNLYMYGGGFDMAAALLAKISPFDLFETRRLLGAAVGLLGLLVIWRIGRRIGGPLAGLIALALLATCPLYYGHMFINPKDSPFAVMMAITLLGMVRAIEEYPQPAPATWLMFGLGLGLSIGSRIMGGFAVLYALAALALIVAVEAYAYGPRRSAVRLGGFMRAIAPSIIVAIAAMALAWPWSVREPFNLLKTIAYFSEFFEKPWRELFACELILAPDMPRSYAPVLLGLQMPEILLTLASVGLVWTLAMVARPLVPTRRRAILLGLSLAAILPVAVAVATRPAMYNGIRHLVFIVPPLALLGGLGANYLLERACEFGRPVAIAAFAVLLAGLASPAVEMIRLHPYQYVYFNHFAGGVRGAEGRYMLDYWGLAFKTASQELRERVPALGMRAEGGRKWKIAVCGPHPPAAIALGEQYDLTWESKDADFAMMLGAFYCAKYDAPVLVEIMREGVVFARVYDIRGRSFPSLFAFPPVKSDQLGNVELRLPARSVHCGLQSRQNHLSISHLTLSRDTPKSAKSCSDIIDSSTRCRHRAR